MAFKYKQIAWAFMLLSILSATLAVPMPIEGGLMERAPSMPNVYAKANLSSLFGWQLAGSQMMETQSWASCLDVSPKWEAIGLDADLIKAPLCNASAAVKDDNVSPWTVVYTTELFISQLLSSFNNTDAFAYICDHVGFNMISSFAINTLDVVQAVCAAGHVQTKPQPEATLPWAPEAAIRAARNTASILFAEIWATAATSVSELSSACSKAPDYVSRIDGELLNGTLVQERLCRIKGPVPTSSARVAIKMWAGRYFTTVIENIVHGDGWLPWLCDHIDSDLLDRAGLFGTIIRDQVCDDSNS